MSNRILAYLMALFVLIFPFQVSAASSWYDVVSQIDGILDQSLQAYEKGDREEAKRLVNEAYFGPFEGERMEQAIRLNISAKRAAEIEFKFNDVKKLINAGKDQQQLQQEVNKLKEMLRADAKYLMKDEKGFGGVLFYSFLIIVREGAEAILIIAAITAYLVKSGNGEKVKEVYQSAGIAILLSMATAYVFHSFFQMSGKAQEVLEGATLLLATVILFSMSVWLVGKADPKQWKQYITSKVQDSISRNKRMALWLAVFLAVYREGAETVLFYQALLMESAQESGGIWLGLIIGSVVLVMLFLLIRCSSIKLPFKTFFLASGMLLYILSIHFTGQGMKELQEAGLFSSTEVNGLSALHSIGVYPTWEATGAQILLLLLGLYVLGKKKVKKSGEEIIHES